MKHISTSKPVINCNKNLSKDGCIKGEEHAKHQEQQWVVSINNAAWKVVAAELTAKKNEETKEF